MNLFRKKNYVFVIMTYNPEQKDYEISIFAWTYKQAEKKLRKIFEDYYPKNWTWYYKGKGH